MKKFGEDGEGGKRKREKENLW